METQIYLVVGGKIREAMARIVGKIAEVRTVYGIREFGPTAYHFTREAAEASRSRKRRRNEDSARTDNQLS